MKINLPTEVLRSFVAIVDMGSMLKATERIFLSQSALSLQMKRLEELLQRQLFEREGKRLVLTQAGEQLLDYARRLLEINDRAVSALAGESMRGPVRIGMVQDFAETLLKGVLQQFAKLHPKTQLEVRIAGSAELMETLKNGGLDVAMCIAPPTEPDNIKSVPTYWIGEEDLLEQETLPLAMLTEPCAFRSGALQALEKAGRRFRIVVETPNLTGLRAAVGAGLGVTSRSLLFMQDQKLPLLDDPSLPPLPDVGYALYASSQRSSAAARLADLVREAVVELG